MICHNTAHRACINVPNGPVAMFCDRCGNTGLPYCKCTTFGIGPWCGGVFRNVLAPHLAVAFPGSYNPRPLIYTSNGECYVCGEIGPAGYPCLTCDVDYNYYHNSKTVARDVVFAKCSECNKTGPIDSICNRRKGELTMGHHCCGEHALECGPLECTACRHVGPALFSCKNVIEDIIYPHKKVMSWCCGLQLVE